MAKSDDAYTKGLVVHNSTADLQAAILRAGNLDLQEVGQMYADSLRDLQKLAKSTDDDKVKLNALTRLSHILREYAQVYAMAIKPQAQQESPPIDAEAVNPWMQGGDA